MLTKIGITFRKYSASKIGVNKKASVGWSAKLDSKIKITFVLSLKNELESRICLMAAFTVL